MKKKKIIVSLLLLTLISPFLVSAAIQGYVSSLYLGSAALHNGAVRKYDYNKHRFEFIADNENQHLPMRLVIGLNKKNLIGYTLHSRKDVAYTKGNKVTVEMGNYGSGNKYYSFGTHSNALNSSGGTGTRYSNIEAGWVSMVSYQ